MGFQINNLDGAILIDLAHPAAPISIDAGTQLTVTGDSTITSLNIGIWGAADTDHLAIDQSGRVEIAGNQVMVDDTVIGVVVLGSQSDFRIEFNDTATYELVQELLRAFTYRSSATALGFTSGRSIEVYIEGESNHWAEAYVFVGDNIVGTAADDIFNADQNSLTGGDRLDGRGGSDTLNLTGGGEFDLTSMSGIISIETLKGSASDEWISIGKDQLNGLALIDGGGHGGPGPENFYGNVLEIRGTATETIDLSDKTIVNFQKILLVGEGASVTLRDAALLGIIVGGGGSGNKVTFDGVLTDAERLQLHRHGVDIVTAKNATGQTIETTHHAPTVAQLDGDYVNTTLNRTVFLDKGQNAVVTSDDGLFRYLFIHVSNGDYTYEQLGFDGSSRIKLSDSKIVVGGIEIGDLDGGGPSLSINFNGNATTALVQELIRALTYKNIAATAPSEQGSVDLQLVDVGGRSTSYTLLFQFNANSPLDAGPGEAPPPPQNAAPTGIDLSHTTVFELAASGTVVGALSAQDPNAGDTFIYKLLDDAGGRFALDASGTKLVVAAGVRLDYEQAKAHTVTVRVTDKGGLSLDRKLTIAIQDVAPEMTAGSDGDDVLVGGVGGDNLKGGLGQDRVTGGLGGDKLWGGSGADLFVFTSAKDSLKSAKGRDTIYDFSAKQKDKIDLKGIDANTRKSGDQAFGFIGKAAFHHKAGELRYEKASGGILVSADVNGDARADFAILLKGLTSISKGYFIL